MPGIGIYAGKTDKQKWRNINMITSVSNAKIKNVMQLNQKAKARREQGLFVAEGRKMFLEAPEEWVSQVFVSESFSQDGELMA